MLGFSTRIGRGIVHGAAVGMGHPPVGCQTGEIAVFFWLHDMPIWLSGVVVVSAFCSFGLAGLFFTRGLVNRIGGKPPLHNKGVDVFFAALAPLYAISAGLIAVAVWEQYSAIDHRVSLEAASLGTLYRNASQFPEPIRTNLENDIRSLTFETMTTEWRRQERGEVRRQFSPWTARIANDIFGFNPSNIRESNLQITSISEFVDFYKLRRERLNADDVGLPGQLYGVVIIGGMLLIFVTYFLALERFPLHVVLTLTTAVMVGLTIFSVISFDYPFRGKVGLSPAAFENNYYNLMSGNRTDGPG
jgi:hypothetical protein